jgi:hypothetical protein
MHPFVRWALLGLVMIVTPWWQYGFYTHRDSLDYTYRLTSIAGQPYRADYAYFFHYLDLYPISWRGMKTPPEPDTISARSILATQGHRLFSRIEYDNLSIFPYLADIWLGGDPRTPIAATGNGLVFTLALMAVYLAFWSARYELLGLLVVALIGSNPFQLYEVYVNDNVFSWAITAGLLVMALLTPLLANHRYFFRQGSWWRRSYPWLAVAAVGIILGSFRHMRTEYITTLPLALAVPFLLLGFRLRARAIMSSLLLAGFLASQWGWTFYFRGKAVEAQHVLLKAGGKIPALYTEDADFHPFWFSFWAGLGDFDTKYGYLFDDNTAKAFVTTMLNREASYDLSSLSDSDKVFRDRVVGDVLRDPRWYFDILARRLHRIVADNTPLQLAYADRTMRLNGANAVPLIGLSILGLLAFCRQYRLMALTLFPLVTGAAAGVITTEGGMHYYSWFHLFVYAYAGALIIETVLALSSFMSGKRLVPSLKTSMN